jgi:hypothetical protein
LIKDSLPLKRVIKKLHYILSSKLFTVRELVRCLVEYPVHLFVFVGNPEAGQVMDLMKEEA